MPHATSKYAFECKIDNWASSFIYRLTNDNRRFKLLFDGEGSVREVLIGETADKRSENPHWFFYDPFDAPEWTAIAWQNVGKSVFERMIGATFDESDFIPRPFRDAAGKHLERFPETWNVMF